MGTTDSSDKLTFSSSSADLVSIYLGSIVSTWGSTTETGNYTITFKKTSESDSTLYCTSVTKAS